MGDHCPSWLELDLGWDILMSSIPPHQIFQANCSQQWLSIGVELFRAIWLIRWHRPYMRLPSFFNALSACFSFVATPALLLLAKSWFAPWICNTRNRDQNEGASFKKPTRPLPIWFTTWSPLSRFDVPDLLTTEESTFSCYRGLLANEYVRDITSCSISKNLVMN